MRVFLFIAALALSIQTSSLTAQERVKGSGAETRRSSARRAPQEKTVANAERLSAEGERLRKQASVPSMLAAIERYKAAVLLWRAVPNQRAEADALTAIAEMYNFLGDNQQALEFGQQALSLNHSLKQQIGEARALFLLGEIHYSLGNIEKALSHHTQALEFWTASQDKSGQTRAYISIGYDHSLLGNVDAALNSFNQALTLAQSINHRQDEAVAVCALATQYSMIGEAQKALALYDRALQFFRASGDRFYQARVLNGLAYIYYQIGEPQQALILYGETLPLYVALGHREGEAGARILIGRIYDEAGRTKQALEQYKLALSISKELSNPLMQSYALGYIGRAFDSLGEFNQAIVNYKAALELNQAAGDRREEAYTLKNIGDALFKRGDRREALERYQQALTLNRSVGDLRGMSLALYDIARVERDIGDLNTARARVEEALQVSEKFRAKVTEYEMRATYFASVHEQYEFYVDVLMRLHRQHPTEKFDIAAFDASERGRARSLLEALAEGRENIREGVDASLLQRERDLQRRMTELTAQRVQLAEDETSAKKVADLEKQLDDVTTEYQQVQGYIRASSPRYAALVHPVPLSLQQVQQNVMDNETLLLQYALGEEHSFVWAVTRDSIKSFELPPRGEIERAARRVYELLTARNLAVKNETTAQRQARVRLAEEEFKRASAALSQMILGPVAAELRQQRIAIVADGALQYLPFAALPSPVKSEEASPLIAEHEVVLLPSTSALALMREELRGRPPTSKTIAILADAVFDKDDERLAATAGSRSRNKPSTMLAFAGSENRALRSFEGLAKGAGISRRLPFSRREADAIKALVPPQDAMVALGFRANRTVATSPELSQYRFIHFATHGLLNSEQPELSGILLSTYDESGKRQNGFLQLHDIYNLKLSADLVVLSACETALGKDIRGEGLLGLTRGFMYAGVPRVIASLWQVDDAATAELMEIFYKAMLTEGKRPAEALRIAQIRMWQQHNQWSSPYYWAAFTLQGEWK